MPQRPIPEYWRLQVKALLAERDGNVSVRQIHLQLKDTAQELLKESDEPTLRALAKAYPSERTISRIKAEEWPRMSETEQGDYRTFHWPESMERRDLPWEASRVTLELLRFFDAEDGVRKRPPIRFVKWFWRVSEAAPGCGIVGRVSAATVLTINELSGKRVSVRGLEWWLAYRPWDGETHRKSYKQATSRAVNPIPGFDGSFTFSGPGSENEAELRIWMAWLFGKSLAESTGTYFWTMFPEGVDTKIIRGEKING